MNVIWKFEVLIADRFQLEMPVGAKILSVQKQDNKMVMWAVCNDHALTELRTFSVVGTGHKVHQLEMPEKYIGTVQMNEGRLVWHLFEL